MVHFVPERVVYFIPECVVHYERNRHTAFTIENNLLQTIPLFKYQEKILPNMFVCAYADIDNGCIQERDYFPYYDEHK